MLHFGRIYAAYGVFVMMSILWGKWIGGTKLDIWDLSDGGICLVGIVLIMYTPRG